MTVSDADIMTIAAFIAALFINRQAFILLAAHLIWEAAFLLPLNDFWMSLTGAAIYSLAATVYIKLKSEIRYVMLTISGLYYLCAVDAFLFPTTETMYYLSIPYLITAMDLYALFLLCNGGRKLVGIHSPLHSRSFGIQLLQKRP